MAYYDDNDVNTWLGIEQDTDDVDACARLFIAQEVQKALDAEEYDGQWFDYSSYREWADSMGEELAYAFRQGDWLDDSNFEAVCGRVDALLPFFLEDYPPIKDRIIW